MPKGRKQRRLSDAYRLPGFRPLARVQGIFGDPGARLITLVRWGKNDLRQLRHGARWLVRPHAAAGPRSACAGYRIFLQMEMRRMDCRRCGTVKRERLDDLLDNALHKRFVHYVGRRCRSETIADVARELHLDWHTVKRLEKQYMQEQLKSPWASSKDSGTKSA